MKLVFSILLFLPLFAGAGLSSYSPRDLLIPSAISSPQTFAPRDQITPSELSEDLDTLTAAFRNGYGGWKKNGPQMEERIFPFLRTQSTKSFSTDQFCILVGSTLDNVMDNHIGVRAYRAGPPCGKTSFKLGSVGKNIKPKGGTPWGYFERTINSISIPIIAITEMSLSENSGWSGFLEKTAKIKQEAKALIVDLRGNHGGDDSKPHELARILYGIEDQAVMLYPPANVVQRQSPEAMGLFSNSFLFSILSFRFRKLPPPPDLENIQNLYLNKFEEALAGRLPSEEKLEIPPFEFDKTKIFKGPIRLLVDSECASSCESVIMFFKNHPNAKIVGENSAGFVHFGNVGMVWLKNSNIFVAVPTSGHEYKDGTFVEKTGFPPDIRVPSGQDALEIALKEIEKRN